MTAARYLCLLIPAALMLIAGRHRKDHAAALLAFVAAAVGVAALHEVARVAGWWGYAPVDGAFRGLPVDLWLGWAALWGAVPVLCRRWLPLPVTLGLLLWLDAVAMPALAPLVRLGPGWLVGEAIGIAAVALPAQLLGRWTADRHRLGARVLLQMAVFAGLALWLVPLVAFDLGDGVWPRPTPVLAQLALLVAAPALLAVREFAVRGGGTPYPWDPPRRLVTTGPYAYLANPMQVSAVALLALLAVAARSATLGAAAVASAAFAWGVARVHERHALAGRHGAAWHAYRRQVRDWWPRWAPYQHGPPATLWLDEDCGACAAVAQFFRVRRAAGLVLVPARESEVRLWRARYAGGDGHDERGVAAVVRGLEHLHLGWAYLAWLLRLPGVTWLAQLMVDAMIAAPHAAVRGEECPPSNGCRTAHSGRSASTASRVSPRAPSPRPPG